MKALEKLCSHFYKVAAIIFSIILPQSIRLTILIIRASWSWCRRTSSKYKYMAAINKKSSKFVYTKELRRLRSEPLICSICLSDFVEGEEGRELLQCKHRFHRNCIEKWLQGWQATCPLCRHLVIPNEIVAEYQISQIVEENNSSEEELALVFLSPLHLHGRLHHGFF
ncbi:probable E3 ubiquitin-protein ligase XERICO [Coffea eugenioides]|uniref:probable E3 ubiquitin-protein ligase XERICO n=1 Tax=Coffea eugenioides TaxID=49369 RepID=UPI000F5CCB34|nr:probable E3 ubiquitin-protein ligase XERICO [Coffea arabica]XP_027150053.1 probable E3 ubiquitin-protein ligase XERICO [Coffea eugenioides]